MAFLVMIISSFLTADNVITKFRCYEKQENQI